MSYLCGNVCTGHGNNGKHSEKLSMIGSFIDQSDYKKT